MSWNRTVALRCSIVVPETYFLSRLTFKCEREGDPRNGLWREHKNVCFYLIYRGSVLGNHVMKLRFVIGLFNWSHPSTSLRIYYKPIFPNDEFLIKWYKLISLRPFVGVTLSLLSSLFCFLKSLLKYKLGRPDRIIKDGFPFIDMPIRGKAFLRRWCVFTSRENWWEATFILNR